MRVVHVIGSLIHGGAEAVLHRLVTAPSDVEHHVVSIGLPGYYSDLIAEHGVPVTHLNARGLGSAAAAAAKLVRVLREVRPDVVQTWMYRANVVGGLFAKRCGIPVVWGVHCASYRETSARAKVWVYLSGGLAKLVPARIINCSAASAKLHERIGFGGAQGLIVPNGIDISRFHPDAQAALAVRAQLGIPIDTFLIGMVGRWHPQKDIPNLIAALGAARTQLPPKWQGLLVGRGLTRENRQLVSLVRSHGVDDHLLLAGERPDVDRLMRSLDVLALPSAEEAFPNVVGEAMASGVPCLVTRVGDAPLIVGGTGWIVLPKDAAALAKSLIEASKAWASDRSTWIARSIECRARIKAHFSLELMVERYRSVWKEVAAEHRSH